MILTGKEDLRVQRTMKTIWNAFEELLYEKTYDKITVKELCERAKINKKTFYTYYETLDDLLGEYQNVYFTEYWESIKDYDIPRDIRLSIAHFIEYASRQSKTYERIMSAVPVKAIGDGIVKEVMDRFWSETAFAKTYPPFYRNMVSTFWVNTTLDIYKSWLDSGKEWPLEDIIATAQELIVAGIESFDQNRPPSARE